MRAEKTETVIADVDLQRAILSQIQRLRRQKVVSINQIVGSLRQEVPRCPLSNRQLVRLVREAAMCLGLIPIFDPERAFDTVQYGYGHPAHRPDPDASYVFEPDCSRVLPVRTDKRWRLSG